MNAGDGNRTSSSNRTFGHLTLAGLRGFEPDVSIKWIPPNGVVERRMIPQEPRLGFFKRVEGMVFTSHRVHFLPFKMTVAEQHAKVIF
jgi:hypothetical protein